MTNNSKRRILEVLFRMYKQTEGVKTIIVQEQIYTCICKLMGGGIGIYGTKKVLVFVF